MKNNNTTKILSFEYLTKEIKNKNLEITIDCYSSLGFEVVSKNQNTLLKKTLVTFKRDRTLKENYVISEFEKTIKDSLSELNTLEKQKSKSGAIFSLVFGIISVLILGIGMSLVLLNETNTTLIISGIIIGVIGIILSSINYPIYKVIKNKGIISIQPKIEATLDILSDNVINSQKLINDLQGGTNGTL